MTEEQPLTTMQQPLTRQIGSRGEAAVDLFFKDLGWGPIQTGDQDLGTDLLVQIRDAGLRDLTLMIGVQVKTGNSWFGSPGELDGRSGWWYREPDQRHANYWTNHPIPHIIVMQKEDRTVCRWAFLSRETILATGQGFKVFIPDEQVFEASQSGVWVDAAVKSLKQFSLEGSRWDFDVDDLPENERSRYALLVPRLVEPHPNKGYSAPISWPEAVALCIQADADRWEYFAQHHESVPSVSEAHASNEWGWRFAAAIHSWLYQATAGPLEILSNVGVGSQHRIARNVALALALVDQGRVEDAKDVLAEDVIENEYSAEQGWLSLHRGRILIEAGELGEGRRLVEQANIQLAPVRRDVTVSALRAAAAWSLFEITEFGLQDLSVVAPALDTVSSWWRTQTVATALESAVTRTFESWAGDKSVNLAVDNPHNLLFSAALVSRLSGQHGHWRTNTALLSMVDLSTKRSQNTDHYEVLDGLRRAGDDKNLGLAVQKIRRVGPLQALRALVNGVKPGSMTRTSSKADLVTIRHAGAFASPKEAHDLLNFLLDSLEHPEVYVSRFAPSYDVVLVLAEALTGLVHAADASQQRRLTRWILGLPDSPNPVLEYSLRQLSSSLSKDTLEENRTLILERVVAVGMAPWFRWYLLAMAGSENVIVRSAVHEGLMAGNLDALDVLRTIDELSEDEARKVLETCGMAIDGYHREGLAGGLSIGAPDGALLFAKIAVFLPGIADWGVLLEFLADTNIVAERKRDTCKFLAAMADRLDDKIRVEIKSILGRLRASPKQITDAIFGMEPIGGAFDELFLALVSENDPALEEGLAALLSGDESHRYDAADYLSSKVGTEWVLVALTADENFRVSRRSMLCLARRLAETDSPRSSYVRVLTRLLDRDGESNALFIAGGLSGSARLSRQLQPVIDRLQAHHSAEVRARASSLVRLMEQDHLQSIDGDLH